MKFIKQLTTLAIFTLNANSPAVAAQSVDATSQRNKCSADCRQLLQQDKYSGTKCAQAVTVHPIPQVFQACMDGERNAFKQACAARCANFNSAETETVPFAKLSSFHACNKHKKGLREKFIWCRKGYDENRERLSTIVSSDIVKDVSDEELADDEPVQRQHLDVSRALVREGDQALEKQLQLQTVTDTLHVTSQHREMIEAGSTIMEQESDLEQFDPQQQQTQLAVAVLPSQETKHLQHGTVSSVIIADCITMRSVSGLSLSDMLACKSSNLAESSSAVSNSNTFNYPPYVLILRPDSFLTTFIGVKSIALFSAEETVEYIDLSTSGWGCNHGGSSLDTLLFLLLEEVFKDNVGARNNSSLPSSHLRKGPNREGFGFGLDRTSKSKSPAVNATSEGDFDLMSRIIEHPLLILRATSEAYPVGNGNGEAKRLEWAFSIRTRSKYLKDLLPLAETSSSLLMTSAQAAEAEVGADDIVAAYGPITLLQLSFDVLSHIWLISMHYRLKPGDSLWLVYLNVSAKYVNVISCQTGSGSDNSHLYGDALKTRSFYIEATALALFFLLLYCHYYSSTMRPLELDLTIEHKKAQLTSNETLLSANKEGCVNDDGRDWEHEVSSTDWKDTLEEIVVKRKFQWQQGLPCIAHLFGMT